VRFVLVGLAGAVGSLSRYGIGLAVGERSFPWTTLAINVTGSFLLGVVLTVAADRGWPPEAVAAVGTGFLGAYTTYSTFAWETFSLGRSDRYAAAAAYLVVSVVLGIAAAAAGYATARALRTA
jgi:CrcB protein